MSGVSINEHLKNIAQEQCQLLQNALENCYNMAVQDMKETYNSLKELYDKNIWSISRTYHLSILKSNITKIQDHYKEYLEEALKRFEKQEENSMEILKSIIYQLENVVNMRDIDKYLDYICDFLSDITEEDPIFTMFQSKNVFTLIFEFIHSSSPDLLQRTLSTPIFQEKLKELINHLDSQCSDILNRQQKNSAKIATYFDNLIEQFDSIQMSNINNGIKIYWFDEAINNDENQRHIQELEEQLPQCTIIQCIGKKQLFQSIRTDFSHELILITSGKTGHLIIKEIDHFINLNSIIIFCFNVEYHHTWAKDYKKIVLVTKVFSDVIDKIQNFLPNISDADVQCCTYDDISLALKTKYNLSYYLSAVPKHGFIITNFNDVLFEYRYYERIMLKLYQTIQNKNMFTHQSFDHFQIENLKSVAKRFAEILVITSKPIQNEIIHFYIEESSYFYRVVNDILNSLDEDLILIFGDFIKTLRYSLIQYNDHTLKREKIKQITVYKGIHLDRQLTTTFIKKFKTQDLIIFPSFLSTSLIQQNALDCCKENGIFLEITIELDQINDGTLPKYISDTAATKNEHEVLFDCFSMLKVTNIEKRKDNFYYYRCILQISESI